MKRRTITGPINNGRLAGVRTGLGPIASENLRGGAVPVNRSVTNKTVNKNIPGRSPEHGGRRYREPWFR